MNHTTNDDDGNPGPDAGRWCDWCGEPIAGEAHLHDGELVCRICWPELRAAEEREAAAEAELELESIADELAEAEAAYELELAELRERERTWRRRSDRARRELRRLEDLSSRDEGRGMRDEGKPPPASGSSLIPHPSSLPEIAGGSPFEPSEEDWADYRVWAERLDRMVEEIAEGGGPEAPYGYE